MDDCGVALKNLTTSAAMLFATDFFFLPPAIVRRYLINPFTLNTLFLFSDFVVVGNVLR